VTSIYLTVSPPIHPVSVLFPLLKFALILFAIKKFEAALPVFDVFRPSSLVNISIFVMINSLKPFVVLEDPSEGVSVEQSELSLDLLVVAPNTLENCTFAEVVDSSPLSLPLPEFSLVSILVYVF
jgi:hypothetical protein